MRVWLVIQGLSVEVRLKFFLPGCCFHLGGQKKAHAGQEERERERPSGPKDHLHSSIQSRVPSPDSSYPLSWLI